MTTLRRPLTSRQTDIYRIYERAGKDGLWPTLSEVARELHISKPTVVEMIYKMVDKGYLIRVGEGRAVKYRIPSVCPTCGSQGSTPERIEAVREAIGAALHSALRKAADGPRGRAAWKAIHDLRNDEWAVATQAAAEEAFQLFVQGASVELYSEQT